MSLPSVVFEIKESVRLFGVATGLPVSGLVISSNVTIDHLRPEDPGVLVLSRFAGAAEQLREALLINPHDKEQCADAIAQALDMPRAERIERWKALDETISRSSLSAWKEQFMTDLRNLGDVNPPPSGNVFAF